MALLLSALAASGTAAAQPTEGKLRPILAAKPDGLVWIEAEDAASTNFSGAPVLDYNSSAFRQLQLNREFSGGGATYYAEYLVTLDRAASWRLWIGGTPPGPRSDLLASFVSPARISVDGAEAFDLYREDVEVNERYTVNNYWYAYKRALKLGPGAHTIRIEINEPRRYDNRNFFFLDALFLAEEGGPVLSASLPRERLPERFPKEPSDRRIDNPFLSIPQYEYLIQTDPSNRANYLLLAQVYSLLGDHGNAVRTLSRGRIVAGDDPRFTLLAAKSRIWSGEVDEGIRLYREYLAHPGADSAIWAEAAKISAWLMKYRDAEAFYRGGLERHPDDLNLKANYALTLLWEGRVREGERLLDSLLRSLADDPDATLALGLIFEQSGYPDKAEGLYRDGLAAFPDRFSFYERLIRAYGRTGRRAEAETLFADIARLFEPIPELTLAVEGLRGEGTLKEKALEGYRRRVSETPDDLGLRRELLQAFYWNGMLNEALFEGENILVAMLYGAMRELDGEISDEYGWMETLRAAQSGWAGIVAEASKESSRLKKAVADRKRTDEPGALEEAIAAAERLVSRASSLEAAVSAAGQAAAGLEAQLKDDSALLAALRPWRWDRIADFNFLESKRRTEELAAPVLDTMRRIVGRSPFQPLDPTALEGLFPPPPAAHALTGEEDLASVSSSLLTAMGELRRRERASVAAAKSAEAAFIRRMSLRLEARMSLFDQESAALRREIADLYIALGRPAEAASQLRRVLLVAPGDSSARFTLARAKESAKDWDGAMAEYRAVYETNPRFGQALSAYNRLAAANPARLEASVKVLVDPSRSDADIKLAYAASPNSDLPLRAAYSLGQRRIHANSPILTPEAAQIHAVELELPFIPASAPAFELTLRAGGAAANKLYDPTPPKLADFPFASLKDYVIAAPSAGLALGWAGDSFGASTSYGFGQLPEGFFQDRFIFYEHTARAAASYYASAPFRALARSVYAELNGSAALRFSPYDRGQDNWTWGLGAQLAIGNAVAEKPELSLNLIASVAWEDSQKAVVDYYAPVDALLALAGPELALRVGDDRRSLGMAAKYRAGASIREGVVAFSWEAIGRAELKLGSVTLFGGLGYAATGGDYYALSVDLGARAAFGDYIIP